MCSRDLAKAFDRVRGEKKENYSNTCSVRNGKGKDWKAFKGFVLLSS